MRPWQHAISSGGDQWTQDLKIHEFIDSTKDLCPDLRHRMILHNSDLGPQILARKFPNSKQLHSIALRHISEDLGCEPSLEDWLKLCNLERLPKIPYRYRSSALVNAVEAVSSKFHLEDAKPSSSIMSESLNSNHCAQLVETYAYSSKSKCRQLVYQLQSKLPNKKSL